MSEWVAHTGGVGAIKHVRRRLDLLRSCGDGTPQQRLVVIQQNMKTRRAAADRSRLSVEPVVRIAHHDYIARNRNLGVQYFAVGTGYSEQLDGAERPLVKGNAVRCTIDVDMGDNRTTVAFWPVHQRYYPRRTKCRCRAFCPKTCKTGRRLATASAESSCPRGRADARLSAVLWTDQSRRPDRAFCSRPQVKPGRESLSRGHRRCSLWANRWTGAPWPRPTR